MDPYDGLQCFWGDLHCHVREARRDRFSSGKLGADGPSTLDEVYTWGRENSRLDFVAVTDHDRHLTDAEWADTMAAARRNSLPGRFLAFLGYEWSHVTGGPSAGYGHRNVIYRGFEGPLLRCDHPDSDTAPKLWCELRKRVRPADVIVIPHHPARAAGSVWWDLDSHDPELERLVEVYSLWGSSEKPGPPFEIHYLEQHSPTGRGEAPGHFVQDALARGLRFGLVAGSESHDGRPGNPLFHGPHHCGKDVCYRGGIQAVYAAALERDALFDAFRARRCYGTTGVKIALEFTVNGRPMGTEIDAAEERTVRGRVSGTDTLAEIAVLRGNEEVFAAAPDTDTAEFEWREVRPGAPADWYYVRVMQRDGNMAWSSPVWVG